MARGKTSKKEAALLWLVVVFLALVHSVTSFANGDWRSGFGAASLVLGFLLWLAIMHIPTHCGVHLQRNRGYCRNELTGLFFGCGSGKHTWTKPLAMIGLGRKAPPPRIVSAPETPTQVGADQQSTTTTGQAPEAEEAVRESNRNRVLFYLTIVSTTAGVLSTSTDLFGVLR